MADKLYDVCPEKLLSQRVEKATELLNRCDNLRKTIEGLPKLRRKLSAELKFLTSVSLLCTITSLPEKINLEWLTVTVTTKLFFSFSLLNEQVHTDIKRTLTRVLRVSV